MLFICEISVVYTKTTGVCNYCIYLTYWDTLSTYHNYPQIWNTPFYYLLMCLNYCCMYDRQCIRWSDAVYCSLWSGSTLFAKASLPQYSIRVITEMWSGFLIEIHIFNDKQCRSRSVGFSEANWSGSTLFAKTGLVMFSKRRVNAETSCSNLEVVELQCHSLIRYFIEGISDG